MNTDGQEESTEGDEQQTERATGGKFAPGNPGGPGRPAGTPNRINALLKDDIQAAYQERGGIEWLKQLSDRDFVRLLEKTMPKELAADLSVRAKHRETVEFTFNIGTVGRPPVRIIDQPQPALPARQSAENVRPGQDGNG